MTASFQRVCEITIGLFLVLAVGSSAATIRPSTPAADNGTPASPPTEHVILFVLEVFSQESLKGGTMPTLSKLLKDGAVTWAASGVKPPLRLPTMASIITGVSVEKHGINWNNFEFSRGYPRSPSVFDYLDLSGGRDSAIFFMDESLYQLARPEPYTDYQMCGPLKPECSSDRVVSYIQTYFKKATSGPRYGHAIISLPHFLVVHLPEAGRVGVSRGRRSEEYREGLRPVWRECNSVLDIYKAPNPMKRTTVFVTSLSA